MSKTLCASVRLKTFEPISNKAYRATDYSGNTDIIPASCYYGEDNDVSKSGAYWIAVWLLEKKSIVWTRKKTDYFDRFGQRDKKKFTCEYVKHKAERVEPVKDNELEELLK